MAKKNDTTSYKMPDETTLRGMVQRRYDKAHKHWESKYNLTKLREDNLKLYDTSYLKSILIDDRYEEFYADNRLFTSVHTILPFATGRITDCDVTPSDDDDDAMFFARDFKKILQLVRDKAMARAKIKLAIQDVLKGQRLGVLKWVYNPTKDCLELEYCPPDSITVDGDSMLYEEPKFVRHTQKRSIGELIRQFPNKKDDIFLKFNIIKGVPSQLEEEKEVSENWMFVDDGETAQYVIVWLLQDLVLGAVTDPNWMNKLPNLIDYPMTPFVFFNLLNDGKGLVDSTSFIEQAQYNQKNYDKLGQRIVEDAAYGGTGVPVFAKGAMKQGEAAKVKFSPIQRIELDTDDVSKAFTTWTGGNMPTFIPNEKQDARNNVDNIFGTPNVFRGEQSNNNTATQDVLVRDQAEGRQAELIDAIDFAMDRFYKLEGQMIYRYFDEKQYLKYKGDDGRLVKLAVEQSKIAGYTDMEITVEALSGVPIDKSQQRATAVKLLELNKIGTLTAYKMLGIENPEEAFKEYVQEQADPKALLDEVDKTIYDHEANEDLQAVIAGQTPDDRDDISETYINYINDYLQTDKYHLLTPKQQAAVSDYLGIILDKAQRKLQKMTSQQEAPGADSSPTPQPQQQALPFPAPQPQMPIDPNTGQPIMQPPMPPQPAPVAPPAPSPGQPVLAMQ